MPIAIDDIPQSVKTDKTIVPFITRSIELADVNPVVSYYCKIYVLDYILSNKLHTTSKDLEEFTIELLENTEAIKNSSDESIKNVLLNKTLSIGVVFTFAYKVFNSTMESLSAADQYTKPQLVSKIKASMNFLTLLDTFSSDSIDWSQLTNGKTTSAEEFTKMNHQKIKILKVNLAKTLKNQLPAQQNDTELENELDLQVQKMQQESELLELVENIDISEENIEKPSFLFTGEKSETLDEEKGAIDEEHDDDLINMSNFKAHDLPGAPAFVPGESESNNSETKPETHDIESINLPGAPHFAPDDEGSEVRLPGVPKFLPDDDLTTINKSSPIHMIQPTGTSAPTLRKPSVQHLQHGHFGETHTPITKETISSIVDRNESINKIQKHAKFAISALNYEDLDTAEKELLQGLELIRLLKQQDETT
jgi:vacuolar protein sorting-associated protein VTA1